jgi:hypothetical protein
VNWRSEIFLNYPITIYSGENMKLNEALSNVKKIHFLKNSREVYQTISGELKEDLKGIGILPIDKTKVNLKPGELYLSIADDLEFNNFNYKEAKEKTGREFGYFMLNNDGSGIIYTSKVNLLYSFSLFILENLKNEDVEKYKQGKIFPSSFLTQRTSYDYFLTQGGRTQKNLNIDEYVKKLARVGFTHIEVNGLAYPMALEQGPIGETYPMFYTYCPAMDQYVYSKLTKGIYPYYYLSANLDFLKKTASLAKKYGITPGLLCFEPRNVPEQVFERYPMLRGCRVDHPFRSFKPRYNLTITHPKVLDHYKEMIQKLLNEVPELEFMSIWTNDSGAGYEHTKSLYVGRNGGAYLIREWKKDEEIAKLAGENILRFLRNLRDAANEINPDFRVITRLESFYGEHDTVWAGLGNKIDVETASTLARGWDASYSHPKYPDVMEVNGTPYQDHFDPREKKLMGEIESKGGEVHFFFSHGPFQMFDPLLGINYPWFTYDKLKSMHENGARCTAAMGGINPPNLAPYSINHEIYKIFQFNQEMNIDIEVEKTAKNWVGEKYSQKLIEAWKLSEEAIRAFPIPVIMFSTYGFAWYRLWTRPLVPNIEAIPEKEREYYETFMCTTPHNPQNVDLMKDVLFELTGQKRCELAVERMDNYLFAPLQKAIDLLQETLKAAEKDTEAYKVLYDQSERMKALKIWFKSMRAVAAWIAGVHGYLETNSADEKIRYAKIVKDMIAMEIENSKDLINLIDTTKITFMASSAYGETPLIYGDNIRENLLKKIKLMEKHANDEPFIDPDYMWKRSGMMIPEAE